MQVNGKQLLDETFAGGNADRPLDKEFHVTFESGPVEIRLINDGPDWVVIQSFKVMGIAPQVRGMACGDGSAAIMRLTAAPGAKLPVSVGVMGLGLKDGSYRMVSIDLSTGKETLGKATVRSGGLTKPLAVNETDVGLILARQGL